MMTAENENAMILNAVKPILDFLAAAFGQHKAVLYEVDARNNSSRAILSNSPLISEGDGLGPIGRQVLANSDRGYHYLIHMGGDEDADSSEKTSYYLIRNSKRAVIGMIMIVYETDYMLKMKRHLDQLLGYERIDNRPVEFNDLYHELESEDFSLGKYASDIISGKISETAIPAERMTMDEKALILRALDALEIFNLKGAVKEAANQLMISPATLYRLLKRKQ